MAGRDWEALPEGWERLEDPSGGPGWVTRPSWWDDRGWESLLDGWEVPGGVGRPIWRSGRGREAHAEGMHFWCVRVVGRPSFNSRQHSVLLVDISSASRATGRSVTSVNFSCGQVTFR